MFKTTLIVVAVLLVVLVSSVLLYAVTLPDIFQVQRSTTIQATAEKIFPLLNDFRRYGEWSPYEKLDPDMQRTYTGSTAGKGSVYDWESAGQAGTGRMEIAEVEAPSRVSIRLDFKKPFECHNIVELTLKPQGDSTQVTWAMSGPSCYVSKVMQVFCNMDQMVGSDFESGLANLKALSEKNAQ